MYKIIVLLPLLFFAVTSAGNVALVSCLGASLPTSVAVTGCNTQGCTLTGGQNVDVILTFTYDGAARLSIRVTASVSGVTLLSGDYPLCGGNVCPREVTEARSFQVPRITVTVTADLQMVVFHTNDPTNVLLCAETRVNVRS